MAIVAEVRQTGLPMRPAVYLANFWRSDCSNWGITPYIVWRAGAVDFLAADKDDWLFATDVAQPFDLFHIMADAIVVLNTSRVIERVDRILSERHGLEDAAA